MTESRSARWKEARTSLLHSLTPVRQRILAVLLDRSTPTTEEELAAELAGSGREEPVEDPSREEIRIRLRHADLPKLADAGLVTWDESDAVVTAVDHPALDENRAERAIEAETDRWDGVVADAPHERRGTVLTLVETRNGPRERGDLAREVAASEADGEPSAEAVDEVGVTLHHVHLPKLERAGLVEYDADDGRVSRPARRVRQ